MKNQEIIFIPCADSGVKNKMNRLYITQYDFYHIKEISLVILYTDPYNLSILLMTCFLFPNRGLLKTRIRQCKLNL